MSDPDTDTDTAALSSALAEVERLVFAVSADPDADRNEVRAIVGRLRLAAGDLEATFCRPRGSRRARGPKGYGDAGFRL